MGPSTSALSGDGATICASQSGRIATPASPINRCNVAATSAGVSPGTMRQFRIARARCGSALSACPPSIRVGVQVVRSRALYSGRADSTASAPRSAASRSIARIAAATGGASIAAVRSKNARVTSLSRTGNV